MTDTAFIQIIRLCETAFTRIQKLDFKTLITFLLNHRKGATQTELDRFFANHLDDDTPRRHITKSACIQARKHLSRKTFIELNQRFFDTLYSHQSKVLKDWHEHRVCAVDGSQLRLPREPALQEKFAVSPSFPVKPSKLWRWPRYIMMPSTRSCSMPSW